MEHAALGPNGLPSRPATRIDAHGEAARRHVGRNHVGVLVFFVVDALRLTGHGAFGTFPACPGWIDGVARFTVSAG